MQTATRAERAGADEEVVFASLLHDIGKAVSVPNHPEIAAAIIKPVRERRRVPHDPPHQDFQGRHYYQHFGGDPDARYKYEGEPWFDLAAQFADDWDQVAFDPDYDTLPLEHFEPLVRARCAKPSFLSLGWLGFAARHRSGVPPSQTRDRLLGSATGRWSTGTPLRGNTTAAGLGFARLEAGPGVGIAVVLVSASHRVVPWCRRPLPWTAVTPFEPTACT